MKTTLDLACEILTAYKPGAAELVTKNPSAYLDSGDPIYTACAELIRRELEAADKKRSGGGAVAVCKTLYKRASKANARFAGTFKDAAGHTCITDGFSGLRLRDPVRSIPEAEQPLDALGRIIDRAAQDAKNALILPSVAELCAYLAAIKAEGKTALERPYYIGAGVFVNAEYLRDILRALPGCTARAGRYKDPVYFSSNDGDAVLLPIRVPEEVRAAAQKNASTA